MTAALLALALAMPPGVHYQGTQGTGMVHWNAPVSYPALIASWGTISTANQYATQDKIIWDGTRYWAFYFKSTSSDTVFYAYSSDLANWTETSTTGLGSSTQVGSSLAVVYDSGSSTLLVTSSLSNHTYSYKRGVISGTTITWGSWTGITGSLSGDDATNGPAFIINQASKPVLAVSTSATGNASCYTSTNVISSTFSDSSWTGVECSGSGSTIGIGRLLSFDAGKFSHVMTDSVGHSWYAYNNGSTWTAGQGQFSPGIEDFNMNAVKVSDGVAYFLTRSAVSGMTLWKTTSQGSSWTTSGIGAPAWPTSGLATTSQVGLVTDGTYLWAFVARGDANNTISYNKYTIGTETWGGWTDLVTSAATRSRVWAGYMNSKIVITWNQVNGSNYETWAYLMTP